MALTAEREEYSSALTAEREEYNAFVSPRLCRGTGAGGAALEMTNVEN
jgi:hypothetical protein